MKEYNLSINTNKSAGLFNDEFVGESLRDGAREIIEKIIKSEKCRNHQKEAEDIKIDASAAPLFWISFRACCDEFADEIDQILKS